MMDILDFLLPDEAWAALQKRNTDYYKKYAAAYSGSPAELRATGIQDSFWERRGKSKIHVPIGADIAATSADLLFGEEPRITCHDDENDDGGSDKQNRLDTIISENGLFSKLTEAAETAAALGEVYMKVTWDTENLTCPNIIVVQADSAYPEYRFGVLKCIHFFTILKTVKSSGSNTNQVYRLYERYEAGKILNAVYLGTAYKLGTLQSNELLKELGLEEETITLVDDMLAAHIPNMKPNREYRDSNIGRSDLEGLRGLMDALDEAYTSWLRDIRLAKSRLIVPAEFLRRKPGDLFKEGQYTYEFDEDVETLVALDIDPEHSSGNAITPSQFEIRSEEHKTICENLISAIVSMAGYSPQTFGIGIDGYAQSGTALHIREKKSISTRGKKENYWRHPLEALLTAVVRLDSHLYPGNLTDDDDQVKVSFPDAMSNDLSNIATSIELLNRAAALSTETKVKMVHPDWTGKQIDEEVARIKAENGMDVEAPNVMLGDFASAFEPEQPEEGEEPEAEQQEIDSGGEE